MKACALMFGCWPDRSQLAQRHEVDHIGLAALQLKDACVVVGDVVDVDLVDRRSVFPVVRVALQDDRIALFPALGVVGPGAAGFPGGGYVEVLRFAGRYQVGGQHGRAEHGQHGRQGCVRLRQDDLDGLGVGNLDFLDRLVVGRPGALFALAHRVQRGLDVLCLHRRTVGVLDAIAQSEGPGQAVRAALPFRGQSRLYALAVGGHAQERIVDVDREEQGRIVIDLPGNEGAERLGIP